jgi:hypothetical protein
VRREYCASSSSDSGGMLAKCSTSSNTRVA